MSTLTQDVARILDGVQRPGDFSTGGVCDLLAPALAVEGVGRLSLPLLPAQAADLVAAAERAPFGRGTETIVDTAVRRTWQIAPDRVRIDGQGWARTLASIVARAADGLGVTGEVEAEFYKLLLYDTGGFFVGHRDTEKAPGMFATLVVVLPSTGTGGELLVRHEGRENRYDLCGADPSQAAFAAFYADCLHEVRPVTAGCRLTLVYNLVRRQARGGVEAPDYTGERARLAALFAGWTADEEAPLKMVCPLEHAYTPAGLAFAALKGADAARAQALSGAAKDAGCDLHLALLSIEESGMAEQTGGYRASRRWREDEEDETFEVVEVQDRTETLSDWRRPDDTAAALGPLPLEPEDLVPPDALDDMAPDDQSFHEATGNEGASFERSYRRAALVLWPKANHLAIVNQGGLSATLPLLADLASRAGGSPSAREDAHELAGHMIATWPRQHYGAARQTPAVDAMLDALARLGDLARIDEFLAEVMSLGQYGEGQAGSVLHALALLDRERVVAHCTEIVAGTVSTDFGAAVDLLAAASAATVAGRLPLVPGDLEPAARILLAGLPGEPARVADLPSWQRPARPAPTALVKTIEALARIDAAAADKAAATVLARPVTFEADEVLVPALLALAGSDVSGTPAVGRLRAAGADHLRRRIALPLAPPADWTREATLTCRCAHCADLGRFLADPARETWSLRAIEHERGHVESTIRSSGSDLDCATLRKGRPYTLLCTKNRASYVRRAKQRGRDIRHLAALDDAPSRTAP